MVGIVAKAAIIDSQKCDRRIVAARDREVLSRGGTANSIVAAPSAAMMVLRM